MYISCIAHVLSLQGPAMVASPYGGVNIEEIAETSPNYIFKDGIDITSGEDDIHVIIYLLLLTQLSCKCFQG